MPLETRIILISGLVSLVLAAVAGQTYQDELSLRLKLRENYSPHIRPVRNQASVMYLHVSININSIHDLDEKKQVLKTTSVMHLEWQNELLTWNVSDFGGIDSILVKPNEIWTPDLVVENSMSQSRPVNLNNVYIRLSHTGQNIWFPGSIMETQCPVNITLYPFDTQTCEIILSSWMYSTNEINIIYIPVPANNTGDLRPNGEWELLEISAFNETISESDYPCLKYSLTLKRRVAYHVLNTVLPILILSALNVLVFVLPPESGEKMSLSITVLLAYTVFLSIINDDMPTTSTSISILSVYILLILVVGTTATFLSATVLHHFHYDEERKRRFFPIGTAPVTQTISPMLVTKACDESSEIHSHPDGALHENLSNKQTSQGTWTYDDRQRWVRNRLVAADRIDVVAFWIMSALIVLLGFICLMTMTVGK